MRPSVISVWLVLLLATGCMSQLNEIERSLWDAVRNDDVNLVKQLLENGTDAKASEYYGETALMQAARYGSERMVELLIPVSDVKATDRYGTTAIMDAARFGTNKMVELLLPGSDAKASNNNGFTLLMHLSKWSSCKNWG